MFIAASSYGAFLTLLVYILCKRLYRRYPFPLLSPIFTSVAVLILFLVCFQIPYHSYIRSSQYFTDMLGPATVAFAIPLHRHFATLRKYAREILTGITFGCVVALVSSVGLSNLLGLGMIVGRSVAPRSVTTPIAMDISRELGGMPNLTAVCVIVTAFVGVAVGPLVTKGLNLRTKMARGTLLGMGAHGIGTSRAFELGGVEGTFASIAMVSAACLTLIVAPWFVPWL